MVKYTTSGDICSPAPPGLDTLEQVPLCALYPKEGIQRNSQAARKENLLKRARAKYVSGVVAAPLTTLRSPLAKQYKLSQTCGAELTETPGKITSKYCGCRWCLVCARIRTARLIKGYMPAIEQMGDNTYFLTVSRPNVKAADLQAEIQHYIRCARLINRFLREKCKLKFSSLRKIECTYNEVANTYHPHFHFVFDDFQAADLFLTQWLARNPAALRDKGNQLKKADAGSAMELFKYFTKVVSKSASGQPGDYRIHVQALDVMFCAMRKVRTFQPCGVIKAVSEDIDEVISEESGREEVNFWQWSGFDWMNSDTAELLTGYAPSAAVLSIAAHLVLPVDPLAPVEFAELPASDFDNESSPVELSKSRSLLLASTKRPSVPAGPPKSPRKAYQSTFFEQLAATPALPPIRPPAPPGG